MRKTEQDRQPARHDQEGFSLIELLVVILILAVLAAIAIPMFLGQREKGYEAQLRSALRGAASAAHAAGMAAGGNYAVLDQNPALLFEQGLRVADGIQVGITAAEESFCVAASHERLSSDHDWKAAGFDSAVGVPAAGATVCPAAALLAATPGPPAPLSGGSTLAGSDGSSSSDGQTAEADPGSSDATDPDPSDDTGTGSTGGQDTSVGTGSTEGASSGDTSTGTTGTDGTTKDNAKPKKPK